jgi:hypothetical protein
VRRYDPVDDTVSTLATGVAEPSGAVLVDGELVVVASAAHRLERPVAPGAMARVRRPAPATPRPATALGVGAVELEVVFVPPPGAHLDERDGPATRLVVTASPPELLADGGGGGTGLRRRLVLAGTEGVLHVAATAGLVRRGRRAPGVPHHPAGLGHPRAARQRRTDVLELVLRGPAA